MSFRVALISVVVLASACAGTARRVRNVTVEGNDQVDDGDLTEGIANREPGLLPGSSADYQPLQLVQRPEQLFSLGGGRAPVFELLRELGRCRFEPFVRS